MLIKKSKEEQDKEYAMKVDAIEKPEPLVKYSDVSLMLGDYLKGLSYRSNIGDHNVLQEIWDLFLTLDVYEEKNQISTSTSIYTPNDNSVKFGFPC